jgi:hypothetical protein
MADYLSLRGGNARRPAPAPESAFVTSCLFSYFQRAGDRTRTGDVQLGKLAFYH